MIETQDIEIKQELDRLVAQFPEYTFDEERQSFIRSVLKKTDKQIRLGLKRKLDSFLEYMIDHEASDIDFGGYGCSEHIWYRIFGVKESAASLGRFGWDETDILINNILTDKDQQYLENYQFVDFSYSIMYNGSPYRFRATAYYDLGHCCMNMRLVNNEIRALKSLNFHENIIKLFNLQYVKHGLILITGITGSGKTTTLDSIIDENNRTNKGHIIIISNPVEFVHKTKFSIVRHREVGRDVTGFKEGTIQALRQDPDIIVIGEMRDPDTIATVLEVADSGHKVFSTLHTSSATDAVDRVLGETPAAEQERIRERLADVLTCVVSQKLVPTLDGKLTLAKEVMVATPAVKTAIRNNHTDEIYQLIYQGGRLGMITMEQSLVNLYRQKIISFREAYSQANHKKRFEDIVKLTTHREQ